MSYAIFRSKSIMILRDLGQIGAHNRRKEKSIKIMEQVIILR